MIQDMIHSGNSMNTTESTNTNIFNSSNIGLDDLKFHKEAQCDTIL